MDNNKPSTHTECPSIEEALETFISDESSFAFELKIQKILNDLGLQTSHSGSYDDSLTQKIRQYDLRTVVTFEHKEAHISVECKKLQPSYPLVIMQTPRALQESYIDVLTDSAINTFTPGLAGGRFGIHRNQQWGYVENELVGRSFQQVGWNTHKNPKAPPILQISDNELYQKFNQSVSSLSDMYIATCQNWNGDKKCIFIPIAVVPNNCLWTIDYDLSGQLTSKAKQANKTSIYIGHEFRFGKKVRLPNINDNWAHLKVSHIEVVTTDGLTAYIKDLSNKLNLNRGICNI